MRRTKRDVGSGAADRAVFLSIREPHAGRIFAGEKSFELRRSRLCFAAGDLVLVYVPTPTRAVVGSFRVAAVLGGPPGVLWSAVAGRCGLSRREYRAYLRGARHASAIRIEPGSPVRFSTPVGLTRLRARTPGFHPPRAYRFVDARDWPDI